MVRFNSILLEGWKFAIDGKRLVSKVGSWARRGAFIIIIIMVQAELAYMFSLVACVA